MAEVHDLKKGRIQASFDRGISLICYAAPGDPRFGEQSLKIYSECGVDIIEIGLPSENPYADGPTVASSMRRSIENGMDAEAVMRNAASLNLDYPDLAKIWMCYDNIDQQSLKNGLKGRAVDGLLMVGFDPSGRDSGIYSQLVNSRLCSIGFVDFNVSAELLGRAKFASGYIMLQARDGITGVTDETVDAKLARNISVLRDAGIEQPIAAGFGISKPDHVRQAIAMGADGVIVGSACLEKAQDGAVELARFLTGLRRAADAREL